MTILSSFEVYCLQHRFIAKFSLWLIGSREGGNELFEVESASHQKPRRWTYVRKQIEVFTNREEIRFPAWGKCISQIQITLKECEIYIDDLQEWLPKKQEETVESQIILRWRTRGIHKLAHTVREIEKKRSLRKTSHVHWKLRNHRIQK